MTLDSAIKYKDFSNPSIVQTRPINIQKANDDYFSATGPAGATQLKLTKVLTVKNAQGQNTNYEVGSVVWAFPIQSITKSNSYIFTTEGQAYILTIGVNAEIYNEKESLETKKGFPFSLVGLTLIGIVIIYTMKKL